MIDQLALHDLISAEDRVAFYELPYSSRQFEAGTYLLRDGEITSHCAILVSGIAYRHKVTSDGSRQIVSICLPGEVINLQQLYLDEADNNVQALNQCQISFISHAALRRLVNQRPSIARAFFASTLVELSMSREWMLSIGRRDARARVAHFLCEIALRLNIDGVPDGTSYELPMTQEQLGDALGLTAVHINRMIMGLVKDNLITRRKHGITIPSWERLVQAAGFNSRYLKLNG
ncbi:Crp/Fnr family transcriptional regulator [Sphingomonas faeni]|uniref:Crp/Fnr family transcriptional regulator n=1 Tax=Sphingomonas faeni TaxID=185950 RepID=UPI0033477951